MRDYLANEVRNIVLMGHSGAGKSSVVEAALYFTKATDRLGKTIDGTSVMDNDAEEIKRGLSVYTSIAPVEWKECKINFIDTPGYLDYEGEDVEGLGFAIPINDAKPIIEDLIAQGYVGGRVSLGVTALDLTSPQLAAQYGYKTPGVYVQSVVENSSAAAGGLQPGDCFVSINGTAIEAISDVTTILNDSSVGDQLEVTVKRDGKIVELSITLQEKKG